MFSSLTITNTGVLKSTKFSVKIVNKGIELLGSMVISKDFPYEKYLRDAKICQFWLGGR